MLALDIFSPLRDCHNHEDNFDKHFREALKSFDKMLQDFPVRTFTTKARLSLVTDMSYVNDDNSCTVEVVAPGYTKNDVEVNITEDLLVVKAAAKEEKKHGLSLTGFERSYKLYRKYDVNSVSAVHKDGILTVTLQPREKAAKEDVKKVVIK